MPNKDFYMKSSAGITIIKSCGNVRMTLIAELPDKFDDIDVALSLLEDAKKSLLAYCESNNIACPINGQISQFKLDMPKSLYNKLAARAYSEKCSFDTLCVYGLSRFLSYGVKESGFWTVR